MYVLLLFTYPKNRALLEDASAFWGNRRIFDPYTFGSCVGSGRTDYVCPVKRFEDSKGLEIPRSCLVAFILAKNQGAISESVPFGLANMIDRRSS